MNFIPAYARLYARTFGAALEGIGKNPWTLALPMGLAGALVLLGMVLAPLGAIGGMLLRLGGYFAFSSYLYFAAGTVANQKVTLADLKKSFLVYFWSVMGLAFVLWIADIVLGAVLANNPNRGVILTGVDLLQLVILNPAPETIYLKGTRAGMDTIGRSIKFVQDNWIEWFIPNGLIFFAVYWVVTHVSFGAFSYAVIVLSGALFHVVMVFRGHLYEVLDGSTHRQRMFKFGRARPD